MRKLIDKLATIILRFLPGFLIVTVPLFFLPLTPDFFQINKTFLIFAAASIALIFFCLRLVTRGHIQITLSPSLLPLAGFTLIVILSTFIKHPNPRYALINYTAVAVSLFILFLSTTSTQKTAIVVKSIITMIIAVSVIMAIFSLLTHFGIISQIPGPEWLKAKLFHPAGSPYHFLTFAVPALIATIGYGIVTKNWLIKPLILAAAIIIAAGSAFSLKLILPSAENQGMALLPYSTGWSIAVDNLKSFKTATLGTGPDTFSQVYTRVRPASMNLTDFWSIRFPSSSSELLTLLTTTGIIGFILFSLSYLLTIKSLLKENFRSDPETAFIFFGLISLFIALALFPGNAVSQLLGVILLIAATIKLKLENSKSVRDVQFDFSAQPISSAYSEAPSTKDRPGLPILPWLLTVSSVVLLAVFWNISSKVYAAGLAVYEASQSVKENPVKAYNKQLEAISLDPTDPYLRINLSQTYISVTRAYLTKENVTDDEKKKALEFANQALNEAKIATNLSPYDINVWENLSLITRYLAENNVQGAIDWTLASYSQTVALDPTNPLLRVQLGTFYFSIGDTDQATKILSQAIELKSNWNIPYYNLSLVYKAEKDYARALAYMKEAQKYTQPNSEDMTSIEKEIAELEKLAPKAEPTPAPQPAQ